MEHLEKNEEKTRSGERKDCFILVEVGTGEMTKRT